MGNEFSPAGRKQTMSRLTADLLHFLLQLIRGFVTFDVAVVKAIGGGDRSRTHESRLCRPIGPSLNPITVRVLEYCANFAFTQMRTRF
jgi:hypothetical protein